MNSRIQTLRAELGWPQHAMAEFLGVQQPSVHRFETGQNRESGPISRLLDALGAGLARGSVKAGMTPAACLSVLDMAPLVDADSPSLTTPGDR